MNLTSLGIPPILYYYIILWAGPEWALGPEKSKNCKLLQDFGYNGYEQARNRRALFSSDLLRPIKKKKDKQTKMESRNEEWPSPPWIIKVLADDRTFYFQDLLESLGTIIVLTAQVIDTSNQTYPNPLSHWARLKGAGYGAMFVSKLVHIWLGGFQLLYSKIAAELC
ncbi:uncharacterized protein LOC136025285 [Artemia franciscana]|uniref:uncharacterized protein LOC136025285 n=1 Tax=Artemia franciscana TaxID=6661 RepID=UPI0032DAF2BC